MEEIKVVISLDWATSLQVLSFVVLGGGFLILYGMKG